MATHAQRIASPSGLVALDVVLRSRAPILPSVIVHLLRQFADASLLAKLLWTCNAKASAAELECILAAHHETQRLDVLRFDCRVSDDDDSSAANVGGSSGDGGAMQPTLTDDDEGHVDDVLKYAARVGCVSVVEWALSTGARVNVYSALYYAAQNAHLDVVMLIYPRVKHSSFSDNQLLYMVAYRGHLRVIQWLHAQNPQALDPVLETAAELGHLDVLQWLYAIASDEWRALVVARVAASSYSPITDWVRAKRIDADMPAAMAAIAHASNYIVLKQLHTQYPHARIAASVLRAMCAEWHRDVVEWLIESFPERYSASSALLSVSASNSS